MAERFSFSNTILEKIPEKAKRETFWDTNIKGLAILVGKKKVFYAVKKSEGKKIFVRLGEFPYISVQEARVLAMRTLADISSGKHKKSKNMPEDSTLAWLLDRYVSDRRTSNPPMKESTAKSMLYHVKHYLPEFMDLKLKKITPDLVDKTYRKVAQTAPTTGHMVFRYLRTLLNYANALAPENDPVFLKNPVSVLSRRRVWSVPPAKTRVLSGTEIGRFIKALEDKRLKNIQLRTFDSVITPSFLLFLLLTGSRKSEAAGLLWTDVSFKDTRVTFRDTKTAAERTIPIHKRLVTILEDLKRINESGKFVFPGPGKTGHLMVHQRVMNNFFKANPDISSFSAHDLRRTFITIGKQVAPGDFVEVIVGHSIQTVTGRHYFHPSVEDLRGPMNLVAEKILSFVVKDP
jgi:integrase